MARWPPGELPLIVKLRAGVDAQKGTKYRRWPMVNPRSTPSPRVSRAEHLAAIRAYLQMPGQVGAIISDWEEWVMPEQDPMFGYAKVSS